MLRNVTVAPKIDGSAKGKRAKEQSVTKSWGGRTQPENYGSHRAR